MSVFFLIDDLSKPYSEPGVPIEIGRVSVLSTTGQKFSKVVLTLEYSGLANITYFGEERTAKFTPSSAPYRFSMQNLGDINNDGLFVIEITETSRRA